MTAAAQHPKRAPMASPPAFLNAPRFSRTEELKIRGWTGLALGALWTLSKTVRIDYVGTRELFAHWARGGQVILAFWHNRMVLMPFPYRGRKACIMNSVHRDGEIISRVISRFNILSVRGSSTWGWAAGLKGMVAAYQAGYDLILVPDGPRGPRYRAKPGVLQLARATGAPVYPVTCGAAWKTTVGSWDRLLIPLPFSRVVYIAGPPVRVPADAAATVMETQRRELERRLRQITTRADAYFTPDQSG